MKVYVFDLDDTLYEERTYVVSGFRAVAGFLSDRFGVDFHESLEWMLAELEKAGRGRIFNRLLVERGLYSARLVRE
jgi:putative hydrolase of the HAD superfamily